MSAGSAGPAGANPALASTFWDATLSLEVAARRVCSPCWAAASRLSSWTAAVATPWPATCGADAELVQVEPAQDRAIAGDEHVVGTETGLLLSQHGAVPVSELGVELVAAV